MNQWISVHDEIPNVLSGKFRIRRSCGIEMDAFFYRDGMAWLAFYGQECSHWWNARSPHERLNDVTHWRKKDDQTT